MTEFARTEPTDEAEKTNLCRKIGENSDGNPTATTSSITNKYWIDSPNLCQSDRILWEADYRRGDTAIYGAMGQAKVSLNGSAYSYIENSGLKIFDSGMYISYDLGGTNAIPLSDIQ